MNDAREALRLLRVLTEELVEPQLGEHAADLADLAAHERDDLDDGAGEVGELVGGHLLRPVARAPPPGADAPRR